MEDPNSIAWLYPAKKEYDKPGSTSKYAWQAIRMNIPGCVPPQGETKSDFRSRESTVSLEDEEDDAADETSYPGIQLTFNSELKGGKGLMFGTHPGCDIVLPNLKHISQRHCALTFDDKHRLILRDFSSTGTSVTYDDKGGGLRHTIITYDDEGRESRHHFTWILGGHKVPRDTGDIVIKIHGINFRIIVSTHDENPRLYNSNVDRFLQEVKANEELPFGGLGIQSLNSTAPPSGTQTSRHDPIRLEQETLGTGAFAVVRRFWDVSTGLDYAYKEPRDQKKFDRKMWEKEADIMSQISHDHVVELIDAIFMPWPRFILEYIPFGSLEDLTNLSVEECMTILRQGLSALVDLHGREEPIVHRDIKPGNILVQSLDPLHIKLTDFGLSRVSKDLTTFCGTALYLAPEVYTKKSYTPVVDIWSLGLVVFQFAYGLPNHHGYTGRRWCKRIIESANDCDSEDLIDFLSTAMLVMEPKSRHSARPCLDRALELSVPSRSHSLTPTPAPVSPDGRLAADPNWHSSQHEDSKPSSVIRRHVRSNAPPPESKPVIDLFGEGWLQDPNCVGSSIAAMGEDSSDWSSWGKQTTEPLERYVPRNIPEPADDPHLTQRGDAFAQDSPVDTVAQGEGNCAWTDNEELMAARVLQAIRGRERL